jgi:hypothetical protein
MSLFTQLSPRVAALLQKTRCNRGRLIFALDATASRAGATKIARVLRHIRTENEREKISAAIFVGDAVEEIPQELYDAAAGLNVPVFWFQEGDNPATPLIQYVGDVPPLQKVETILRELARLTNGAYARFDAGAAAKLAELLQAVAAFAVGGITALANQHTDCARKLLSQMK